MTRPALGRALILLMLGLVALAACARAPTPAPTPGPVAIFTPPSSPAPLPYPPPQAPASLPPYPPPLTQTPGPIPTKPPPPPPRTPTPSPTWPVIIPATATPGGTPAPTHTSVLDLRPTSMPLPTERYQAMIRALEPFPTFEPPPKALPLTRVEVWPEQIVELGVDHDSQTETLLAYLIHPVYGDPPVYGGSAGELGLALFDSDDRLVWRSKLALLTASLDLEAVGAVPVSLARGETGLFFYYRTLNGHSRTGLMILYRWDGHEFKQVWQGMADGSGSAGFCCGRGMTEAIWLEDVDNDGRAEVLTERVEGARELEWEFRAYNYQLYLPGTLAFRWDGSAYTLAYFLNDGRLTPIHPQLPLIFAPRLSYPLDVDGSLDDWKQVEYLQGGIPYYFEEPEDIQLDPPMQVAWDEHTLYLMTHVPLSQTVTVAIDPNLAGGFSKAALSGDDVVLEAALPSGQDCAGPVTTRLRYPFRESPPIEAAVGHPMSGYGCVLELAIPFDLLGLDGRTLVTTPGWVAGGLGPRDLREYHPRAGKVIGFAVALDGRASSPDFRWDDPTTWNTLVFMADR